VFAALYQVTAGPVYSSERLVEVEAPTVGGPAATLARWRGMTAGLEVTFAGDGARLYADVIAGESRAGWTIRAAELPLAGAIGRMARARAARGEAVDPAGIQPLYVRRPDAELDRERRRLIAGDDRDAR
jgi:hypothetical protein